MAAAMYSPVMSDLDRAIDQLRDLSVDLVSFFEQVGKSYHVIHGSEHSFSSPRLRNQSEPSAGLASGIYASCTARRDGLVYGRDEPIAKSDLLANTGTGWDQC